MPRSGPRPASSRIAIALDGLSGKEAIALVDRLGDLASLYKVGPALLLAEGPALLDELRARERSIFLDLKFHDIPQTVASAVVEAARSRVSLLTVHAAGGRSMLRAARAAVSPGGGTRLLAVTLLTSLDGVALREILGDREGGGDPAALALHLARVAREEGIDGVVASPLEARALRASLGSEALIVTPGIRGPGEPRADQRRTLSAGEAIAAGADLIVVGRPIVQAPSPRDALAAILDDIEGAIR